MGKISQGILGGLSGKVGNVIGGSWKGIDYLRIKPSSVANPRTEGQVNQRNKFTATLEFLQPNKEFINVGYKSFAIKKTAFNAAMSEILANGITGDAPNFEVDYPNALLSKGNLAGVLNPTFDDSTPGQLTLGWSDNSSLVNASSQDQLFVCIYNPAKKESVIKYGTSRLMTSQILAIPSAYAGDTVHVYFAFVSSDKKQVSNSSYVGSFEAS
jgi:hypothetical protein